MKTRPILKQKKNKINKINKKNKVTPAKKVFHGLTSNSNALKIRERMSSIKNELRCYQESIHRLQAFAEGRAALKGKRRAASAQRRRTKADDQRLRWTLSNVRLQILLLEKELAVLMEYGADTRGQSHER